MQTETMAAPPADVGPKAPPAEGQPKPTPPAKKRPKNTRKQARPATKRSPRVAAILKDFGQRMKAARMRAKLTMPKLAKRAGCSLSYVSMLERGQREPTIAAVLDLARGLKVKPSSILNLDA